MSLYKAFRTSRFKKDYKRALKRGKDIERLNEVILMLANGEKLPEVMHDHELSGIWRGFRECHIEPDWLLIYGFDNDVLVLSLIRTGTHGDLFG